MNKVSMPIKTPETNQYAIEIYLKEASEGIDKLKNKVKNCDGSNIINIPIVVVRMLHSAAGELNEPVNLRSDFIRKADKEIENIEKDLSILNDKFNSKCLCNKK